MGRRKKLKNPWLTWLSERMHGSAGPVQGIRGIEPPSGARAYTPGIDLKTDYKAPAPKQKDQKGTPFAVARSGTYDQRGRPVPPEKKQNPITGTPRTIPAGKSIGYDRRAKKTPPARKQPRGKKA